MTSPASRPLSVPVPSHTRCDTSRSTISLAQARRTVRRACFRASPCGAARPLRAWLVGIGILWSALWAQLAVDHGTLGEVVAFSLFSIACALTVLYGMRSGAERSRRATRSLTRITGSRDTEDASYVRRTRSRRAPSPQAPPGIVRSSAVGVGLLGPISWIPLTPLLGLVLIGALAGSPIGLLLAAAITGVIAAAGLLLLVLLMGLGRLCALWTMREQLKGGRCE